MQPNKITERSHPDLFDYLCQDPETVGEHPKHGKSQLNCYASLEDGTKYECYVLWDYSWGIDWDYVEWTKVEEFVKTCPCCGQEIPE